MTHWTQQAACREVEPELFSIPGSGLAWGQDQHANQRRAAAAVCAECPVVLACRVAAIDSSDMDTFRGGMTPQQRAAWRRRQRKAS